MVKPRFVVSFIFCLLVYFSGYAQRNNAARYEIDAKRIGVMPNDKDALPRSREFIRLDSTYYVGWMYEGVYKFERSSDYLGYKYAIVPLRKAFDLLTKDFGNTFKKLFSSPMYYMENQSRFNDLYIISTTLQQDYNNVEMPDSVMAMLNKIDSYHFQKDFFSTCNERGWLYHRYRFFNGDKFDFLKNSVEENEKMALHSCYQGFEKIQKNQAVNDYWYGPHQSDEDRLIIYHNLAIIHAYNQHYDSCEYYYKKLEEGNRILWGNYAELQMEIGNFDKGMEYFAKHQNIREHGLDEQCYFVPILNVFKGNTKLAISATLDKISKSGSIPGFGWYTIALARSYLYDGQLDSCEFYLSKAANFKEVHIGTTLTQSQYEFTITLLKVQLNDRKIALIKFQNKAWWYSFTDVYNLVALKIENYLNTYVVVNQLANNPERKRIVYDLFCNESTITFDETMGLLKNFSYSYFQNKYVNYQLTDKRKKIQRYFKLFCSELKYEHGDEQASAAEASQLLQQTSGPAPNDTLNDVLADTATEKLFYARLYELLAKTHEGDDEKTKYKMYSSKFFETYPQLVPFSGLKLPMHLTVTGEMDEMVTKVIKDLKGANIEWVNEAQGEITSTIQFTKKGKQYEAIVNVKTASGTTVVNNEQLVFKNEKGVGQELAQRLFGKGGVVEFEETNDKLPH